MFYFVMFFIEIIMLFLLSRSMSRNLSRFMSINFLSFIFLPGVIIHELSHLLTAVILFVPVGNMDFTPQVSNGSLKLGSVEIAKTDPIRRSIIGFAPVFMGLALVVSIVYFFTNNILFFRDKSVYLVVPAVLFMAYLLFAISNTMFSSRRDMEGTLEILITLSIMSVAAYALGFRLPSFFIEKLFVKEFFETVRNISIFLSATVVIDLIALGAMIMMGRKRK